MKLEKKIEDIINIGSDENANKPSHLFNVKRDLIAGEIMRDMTEKKLPKDIVEAHKNKTIHWHDSDFYGNITNCCIVNLEDMLQNGTKINNANVEQPKSIGVACTVASQIVANIAHQQYGGISLPDFNEILASYAKLSFNKNFKKILDIFDFEKNTPYGQHILKNLDKEFFGYEEAKEVFKDDDDTLRQIEKVKEWTAKDIYDACQTFEYQTNSISSASQTPFSTITFNIPTSWESECIVESYLKVRMEGLGAKKQIAIFPKISYFYIPEYNGKGSKYYHLTELAAKCISKCFYPDILHYSKEEYDAGRYYARMGCVHGDEVIHYKYNNIEYVESFSRFYDKINKDFESKDFSSVSQYIEVDNLFIEDVNKSWTKVLKVIKNKDVDNFSKLKLSNGRCVVATKDHPFVTKEGRKFLRDLNTDDVLYRGEYKLEKDGNKNIEDAWLLGLLICDSSFDHNIRISLANEGEDDILDKSVKELKKKYPNNTVKIVNQNRGKKGIYKDILVQGIGSTNICRELQSLFGGKRKIDRSIPFQVFNSNKKSKLDFLGGMIDADGYINKNGIIQLGSTNKELALQQMYLVNSLGYESKFYESKYGAGENKFRYRVEFKVNDEILKSIVCLKKINNIEKIYNDNINNSCSILEIKSINNIIDYSYDVETESDTFIVSGIQSHNCRSRVTHEYTENGLPKRSGRFNTGAVTINLPQQALLSESVEDFFDKLKDVSENIVEKALVTRFNIVKDMKAKDAPILFMHGAIARLEAEQSIEHLARTSLASISYGYIGIDDCVRILSNKTIKDEGGRKLGLKIIEFLNSEVKRIAKKHTIPCTLYSTPAESLISTAFDEDYKNLSNRMPKWLIDRGYYTNSYHFSSELPIDAVTKLKIESEFVKYANGGNINYTELGLVKYNQKAILDLIDYGHSIGIDYQGFNIRNDICYSCGFEGEILYDVKNKKYTCPKCGNTDGQEMNIIERLCGYLGNTNERGARSGRMKEIKNRACHV